MILDLKKLKAQGKQESSFCFEYAPEIDLISIPSATIVEPVIVTGNVTLTGEHSCYLDAEVSFTVSGECTRCLKTTTNKYVAVIEEEIDENNENGYTLFNDTINLSKIVDDAIIINLPVSFLCDENCKGICPDCGVNLNDGECKCK